VIVALSGYYGFDNTGDEAILLSITRELKQLGHTPLVLSNTPTATAQTYGVQAAHRMKPFELLAALWRCDALLSGGGGLLQDKTSRKSLDYYLWVIRLARLLGKKVAVFNQSIGPLSTEGGQVVSSALKNLKAIVRDTQSVSTLAGIGVKAMLGGDPALLLEPNNQTREEQLIVIAPRGGQPEATKRLVKLAESLVTSGHKIMALSFQPGVDTAEIEAFRHLPNTRLEETADPQHALDLIASAGAVIGVRLHAVILGAAAGTRFYGIAYDPKVAGFCADASAPSYPVDFALQDLQRDILMCRAPNWTAVHMMRERCRTSFQLALA
jgi:polysaccharide pyruvyl transferase CsaB